MRTLMVRIIMIDHDDLRLVVFLMNCLVRLLNAADSIGTLSSSKILTSPMISGYCFARRSSTVIANAFTATFSLGD